MSWRNRAISFCRHLVWRDREERELDEEVRAYFDAHHEEFKEPERRRVAHVVVASETQAKAALHTALGASAADWGKLVSDVSLDKPPKSAGPMTACATTCGK